MYFKDISKMISDETLMNYPDWKIISTVHIDAYEKQVGASTIQNNNQLLYSRKY